MECITKEALAAIKEHIIGASVESFGLSHQIHYIDFRHPTLGDTRFEIDSKISALPEMGIKNTLTYDQYVLLCFDSFNLKTVIDVWVDADNNLHISFEDNRILVFAGSIDDGAEVWVFRTLDYRFGDSRHVCIWALSK